MTKDEILKRIEEIGVIPVVRAKSAEEAVAVAEAIGEGGIHIKRCIFQINIGIRCLKVQGGW